MGVFTRSQPANNPDGLPPSPLNTPRALVGSSERIRVADRTSVETFRRTLAADTEWQPRAWHAYEHLGEVWFAFNLVGNVISRIRFYPAADVTPNVAPAYVDDVRDLTPGIGNAAKAAMRRITDTNGDFSSIARHLAINLSVPGECYLVQIPARTVMTASGVETIPESWEVRSKDEVIVPNDRDAQIKIKARPTDRESDLITLPKNAFIARIWRRNPRYMGLADSSMRAVLDLVDELMLINETFKATARSRLNSGILFVPDGLSASSPTLFDMEVLDATGTLTPEPQPADVDEFEEALLEGMMTPIADPSSASAVVPILVRGPGEVGEKIKLIQFERTFDPSLVQRSDRVLERILQGLDLPKDVFSGLANVRYSNAQTIEESLWRAHIEPLTLIICDALTDVYLRPALMATGYTREQAARCRVWYDPSEVVARPNRNQDAVQAYDRYALSATSLREAMGFNEADAPPPAELVLRMLLQKGPITPDLAEALMRAIAPLTMNSARNAAAEASENPLPPEVQELLNPGGPRPPAEAEAETEPEAPPEGPGNVNPVPPAQAAPPASPVEPAPSASNVRGPRAGRAAETPLGDGASLLPPRQNP